MKTKYLLLLILLVVISSVVFIFHIWTRAPYTEIERIIENINTEEEVIKVFGKPHKIFYKGEKDYYVKGYSFKRRLIQNKVYIYFPKMHSSDYVDIILYVYFDNNNLVEDYFVGGS